MCALREYLDRNGTAWPSYGTLAAQTNQSRRGVMKQVREAERRGLLSIERHVRANVYHAILPDDGQVVNGCSPSMVNGGSPVMVNGAVRDGEPGGKRLVNSGSPQIRNKKNTPRNGESRNALQGAARSPAPAPELPARLDRVAQRVRDRIEAQSAARVPRRPIGDEP